MASQAMSVRRRSIATWVMASSWTQCGHPHRTLPGAQRRQVLRQRLREQHHVALLDELLARAQTADLRGEPVVGDAEPLPVAALEEDPAPQVGVDPSQVLGVDRHPLLVRLARRRDDTQAQLLHACSCPRAEAFCPVLGFDAASAGDPRTCAPRSMVRSRMAMVTHGEGGRLDAGPVELGGTGLAPEEVVAVARRDAPVTLGAEARRGDGRGAPTWSSGWRPATSPSTASRPASARWPTSRSRRTGARSCSARSSARTPRAWGRRSSARSCGR